MTIVPIHPLDAETSTRAPSSDERTEAASRRTFGMGHPSRRTFGLYHPSRRTFGQYHPSRRTFGVNHP